MITEGQRLKTVVEIFNQLFADRLNTRLIGGAPEPIYIPAGYSEGGVNNEKEVCDYHRLYFREDYLSSALHESAHWCLAGATRRQQLDFGYWYNPDGRSEQQQTLFEQAETKPQALEWMFSVACGWQFRVSADNLMAGIGASDSFARAVVEQALYWSSGTRIPQRAELLLNALASCFGVKNFKCSGHYLLDKVAAG